MKYLVIVLLFPCILFSQTKDDKKNILKNTNVSFLSKLAERETIQFFENKKRAENFAKIYNWPLTTLKDSVFSELIDVTKDLKPIYVSTFNKGAGITSRANKLHSGGSLGLNINGENMTAAVWDAGNGMPNHELFTNRMLVKDGTTYSHYHSAHVAGTIMGAGQFQNGEAKGMAFKANLDSYDWNDDKAEIAVAAANGLLLSNHSYGRNPYFVSEAEWGKYDVQSQTCDDIMFNAPYYQFVCAAGNSRGSANTSKNGYDVISGHALSKNGITVGAVNELLNYTNASSVQMSSFSSWGPSDDGRIKPDICAKGVDTFSASDASTSSYTTLSGTSMASPSVAGTLLLFQQYYKQLNNSFMKAATLKGLMIHTADEAGASAGPDYSFGWGLINAEKAADVIKKNKLQSQILENTLSNNTSFSLGVNALGTEPLIATLCWTDPKGNLPDSITDSPNPNLINDLDIRITKNSSVTYPWKLNPANLSGAAIQGDNIVDNVEKVAINNPTGSYSITVTHKGNLVNNLQNYSLIISGVTAKDFWITGLENSKFICDGSSSVSYAFNLQTKSNFTDTVSLSTINLPAGITATFTLQTLTASGAFGLNLTNLSALLPGVYNFTVKGTSAFDFFETQVTLTISSPAIANVVKTIPADNAFSVALPASFGWIADTNAQSYDIEIATDINFTTIVQSVNTAQNSFISTVLTNNNTYFWRVKSKNICGVGTFSAPFRFNTVCGLPNNITANTVTTNSAVLSWTDTFLPNSWEVEIVPQGTNPTGTGIIVNSTSYPVIGLTANSCYNFYLRSNCGSSNSSWTLPFTFCTTPDYCGGDHFYDTGGLSGDYQNNENYIKTINPNGNGNRIKAVFNSFDTEPGYDYLSVYNGPDTNSPLLFTGSGTNIPAILASTHPSGSLTFRFNSDQVIKKSGWDASIICEPMPACPITPDNISVSNINYTTATFNWSSSAASLSWEIEIVPRGTIPTGVGLPITTKPYLAANLMSNTKYDFYVRSVCSGGFSDWSIVTPFTTKANYCGGDHFYDNGGPNANHPNYDNSVTTISPQNIGDRVKINFDSFALGTNSYFIIFNGNDTYGEVLFEYNGTNAPTTTKSTMPNGALTIAFYSSTSNTASGWDASVVCETLPPCARVPKNINLINSTTTTATLEWIENSSATQWEVEIVPHGSVPTGTGIVISSNPYTASGLSSNTWYDFYVRSKCSIGSSDWSAVYTFHTKANYCAGDHFYDDGGPNDNYNKYIYSITTINPSGVGNRVKAIFNSFQIANYTSFTAHNGPNANYPLLYSSGGGSPSPTTLIATNPQGALTFVFNSNSTTSEPGWDATIICEPLPPCSSAPSNVYVNNVTTNSGTFSWTENSNSNSWEIEIVARGTTPTGTGIITSSNPYTKNGLTSNTWYDFYVRSKCGTANSLWTGPMKFNTNADYCAGDHYYDTGGPNENYNSYESYQKTIYSTITGYRVKAIFNSFQINNGSQFRVYNSPNSYYASTLIYDSAANGNANPGTLLSTNNDGALTFVFYNYSQSTASGWDASIICEPLPPCSNQPSNLYLIESDLSTARFNWAENSNATSWEIEVVPHGTTPTGVGIITSSNSFMKTGLTSNTWYDFYVRSKCGAANSLWSGPLVFNTKANYCAGDHFYDDAGPNDNYLPYTYTYKTILPTANGDRIKAVFNSFQLNQYDGFTVYNGTSSNSPIVFTRSNGNTAIPTTLTATNPQGALTFQFSASYQANAGWDATIICEPLPPCSNQPSDISGSNISTNAATFNWLENSNATSWEIEIVAQNANPTGTGIITSAKPYSVNNLTSNTWYDFYIRSKCGNVNSNWAGPIKFNTNANYCAGDHFYDNGGPNGNYPIYDYQTKTIYPVGNGNRIKAIFNSFQLNSYDYFAVFDGDNTNAPILFDRSNNNLGAPPTLTATNVQGAMTFVFYSYNAPNIGWDATIVCETLPPCAAKPTAVNINNAPTTNSASFSWLENSNATQWEIEIVPQNSTPTGTGIIVNSNPYTANNLTSNTWYDFYVRAKCGNVNSEWTAPLKFRTEANYCAGDHFYDNGGPNGNYPIYDNVYRTIFPTTSGDRIKAIFNTFQITTNDSFYVFDGADSNAPILYSKNPGTTGIAPTTLVATNPLGLMTFYFYCSQQTNIGWDATIICEPLPPCSNKPSNLNLTDSTTTSATFAWIENSSSTSWEIEIVAQNTPPTGNGLVVSSNPYTANNLISNTWYDFYVRSKCGNVNSAWAGPLKFNTKANYCAGDHFYDNGGPTGDYLPYDYSFKTIYPSVAGERVKAIFNTFQLGNYDNFIVYNGLDNNAPILFYRDSGNLFVPATITANNAQGALTFYLYGSYQSNSGWDATILCEPIPQCSIAPSNVMLNNITARTASVNWVENASATSWEIQVVPEGTQPVTSTGTICTVKPFLLTNLDSNSCKDIYVRSICGAEKSNWSMVQNFCTQLDYCGGDHFYDTGGANGNYSNNENYLTTIYPEDPNSKVTVTFNSFQMQSSFDILKIYNGPDISSPLLGVGTGINSPGTRTSTHTTGALTFHFTSNNSTNYSGWDATITCAMLSNTENEIFSTLEFYPNPVTNRLHINTKENVESFEVFDINMRVIMSEKINANNFDIDLATFSAGAYFVKLTNIDGNSKKLKILKN